MKWGKLKLVEIEISQLSSKKEEIEILTGTLS